MNFVYKSKSKNVNLYLIRPKNFLKSIIFMASINFREIVNELTFFSESKRNKSEVDASD